MQIRYSKKAIKYLIKMQASKATKIRESIARIANGDTEGLNIVQMEAVDAYRLRVGDFRVIYEINENELILIVIKVGPRGDIYK
jgi:mRNA interferase RelE/StbE